MVSAAGQKSFLWLTKICPAQREQRSGSLLLHRIEAEGPLTTSLTFLQTPTRAEVPKHFGAWFRAVTEHFFGRVLQLLHYLILTAVKSNDFIVLYM